MRMWKSKNIGLTEQLTWTELAADMALHLATTIISPLIDIDETYIRVYIFIT